jgi:NAD(P)-dependent dehydrogenase (short-subunit alcohol dehydrogenase family)
MNLCIVHRDRRAAMSYIEPEFQRIRQTGVRLLTFNDDALDPVVRAAILEELVKGSAPDGRVHLLLHSIASGRLRLVAPDRPEPAIAPAIAALADAFGIEQEVVNSKVNDLSARFPSFAALTSAPRYAQRLLDEDDFVQTIHAMGTSHLAWAQAVYERRLFGEDARILALTSEGNTVAWKGYAAVSAAKLALEGITRALAVELAPYGIRANVIQAGITDTPALRAIPGHERLRAHAHLRNPCGRLTTPRDIANVVYLLATEEASWINGALVRADGGEHVGGGV